MNSGVLLSILSVTLYKLGETLKLIHTSVPIILPCPLFVLGCHLGTPITKETHRTHLDDTFPILVVHSSIGKLRQFILHDSRTLDKVLGIDEKLEVTNEVVRHKYPTMFNNKLVHKLDGIVKVHVFCNLDTIFGARIHVTPVLSVQTNIVILLLFK